MTMLKPKRAPYATTTKDPDTTIADINRMLRSYGISNIQWTTAWERQMVELRFAIEKEPGKFIGIRVRPPAFAAVRRTWDEKTGKYKRLEAPNWAQSLRMLLWWLKAKVEAVAFGLREVEEEFLSDVIVRLPSGEETTVGEVVRPAMTDGTLDLPKLRGKDE
jgi:hypothetical protein